jgi:hypothetical protein
VSYAAHPASAPPQVCPFAPRRGRRLWVAFSLVTFFWRSKRKLLRRRRTSRPAALSKAPKTYFPTRSLSLPASNCSFSAASSGTQSPVLTQSESFSIACHRSAIWCSCEEALSIRPAHGQRHRVVFQRDAVSRKLRLGFGVLGHVSALAGSLDGMMRAGMPTAVAPAGTGLITTALLPILAPSPTSKAAQHLGASTDHHVLAQRRMPLGALVERGSAQRHALVNRAAVADFCGFANHHTHSVVEKRAFADDLAPGWISMPVSQREMCETKRPSHLRPCLSSRQCARRCSQDGVQARVTGHAPPRCCARQGRGRGCTGCRSGVWQNMGWFLGLKANSLSSALAGLAFLHHGLGHTAQDVDLLRHSVARG